VLFPRSINSSSNPTPRSLKYWQRVSYRRLADMEYRDDEMALFEPSPMRAFISLRCHRQKPSASTGRLPRSLPPRSAALS